jgi:hypothetical protein
MAHTYESDTFRVLRAAISNLCETAIYAESESENPCPDYLAELRGASRAIGAARSIDDLVAVGWVAREAALGAEGMDSTLA